jgi:integrase
MRFTDRGIQALQRKSQRYEIVEDGATGLAVRVSPRGIKAFCYLYRFGGKPRRLTLGLYRDPSLVSAASALTHDARGLPYLSLADARIKLAEARKQRDGGVDPAAEAVQAHRVERTAETIDQLIDAYIAKHVKGNFRERSAAEEERILRKDVSPEWGKRKISHFKKKDAIALTDAIVPRGRVIANRTMSAIRRLFRWAERQSIIEASPLRDMPQPGGREAPAERSLTDQEIAEVWQATGSLGYPYGPLIRLLLVTGQRRGEVAGMRDSEMMPPAKLWTIPGGKNGRTKNRLAHEVPLSPLALEIIADLPKDDDKPTDCLFVSGYRGDEPAGAFKDAKKKLDKLIQAARAELLREAGEDPAMAAPMPRWTLHNLRRTARTGFSALPQRFAPEMCERVINHVPGGVRRTYDVHQYREEKREILNAWARRLKQIIAEQPAASGRVVRLRRAD